MATREDLETAIDEERREVAKRVEELVTEVERLRGQVANGTVLMPADFDTLVERVRAIHTPPAA